MRRPPILRHRTALDSSSPIRITVSNCHIDPLPNIYVQLPWSAQTCSRSNPQLAFKGCAYKNAADTILIQRQRLAQPMRV